MMHVEERQQQTPAEAQKPHPTGWWGRVWRFFFFQSNRESSAEQEARLHDLNGAIAFYPDAAVNYLLRGELHLARRETHLARADFEAALERAEAELHEERWGITAQSLADRARTHLHRLRVELD